MDDTCKAVYGSGWVLVGRLESVISINDVSSVGYWSTMHMYTVAQMLIGDISS